MALRSFVRRRRWGSARVALAAVAALSVLAAGCGSSSATTGETSGSGAKGSGEFRSLLPASIRAKGYLTDASSFDYPPWDFTAANGSFEGIEPDILNAMAPLLGVQVRFEHLQGFATLIPAVSSGRVDMAAESIGVLPARRTQVSYVQYVELEDGLLVKTGNPSGISLSDVCGHSVSVEDGAEEVGLYQSLSQQCVSAGKKAVNVQSYSSEASQVLAVENGHADAVGVGSEVCAYIAKQSNGQLQALHGGIPNHQIPAGMVVAKNNAQLGKALLAAMKQLKASGKLASILNKYGMDSRQINLEFLPSTG